MNEQRDITRETSSIRRMFIALADEYPNAVLSGKEAAWGKMAHSYIDLVLSRDPLPKVVAAPASQTGDI